MDYPADRTETKINLPEDFLLGAASSAYQVEGGNFNSDWWKHEQEGRLPKSGSACDHYNRYDEDFGIAKELGMNAFRISIEWSRIEPLENQWNPVAIEHYRKVLRKMKDLKLSRMVTLHHFTLPQWLSEKGGFETKEGSEAFARFAWFVARNLGEEVDLWCTINEPEVYVSGGYKIGKWPPFKKSLLLALRVERNLIEAHKAAFRAIKEAVPQAKVGIVKNNVYYEPYRKRNPFDRLAAFLADRFGNHYFLRKIRNETDFIGLNYYFYDRLKVEWKTVREMNFNFAHNRPETEAVPRSDMGWRTYPEGLFHLLLDLRRYRKPVYITENGIANARDDMRKDFIREHLYWVGEAIANGVDVKGYYYWSLTDNYEWADGYGPRFGLVEIDYGTQKRTIRPSASVFKEIKG